MYIETIAQIPEVEFWGKYGYLRENTDILRANTDIALRANNQH
jgi:hypothetical protein